MDVWLDLPQAMARVSTIHATIGCDGLLSCSHRLVLPVRDPCILLGADFYGIMLNAVKLFSSFAAPFPSSDSQYCVQSCLEAECPQSSN